MHETLSFLRVISLTKNFIAVFREVISSLLSMSVMNGHGYNNKVLYPK